MSSSKSRAFIDIAVRVTCFAGVVGCLIFLYLSFKRESNSTTSPPVIPSPVNSVPETDRVDIPLLASVAPPPFFSEFAPMLSKERKQFAADLIDRSQFEADELQYMKDVLSTDLDIGTKELISTAVLYHEKDNPDLSMFYVELAKSAVDHKWRDYCVQYILQSYPFSSRDPGIEEYLVHAANDNSLGVRGTAIIALGRLSRKGLMDYPMNAKAILDDQHAPADAKMAVITSIGEQKDYSKHELMKRVAKRSESIALKRTAIATLGLIGDKKDLVDLRKYLKHENKLIQYAAKGAIKRITLACSGSTAVNAK